MHTPHKKASAARGHNLRISITSDHLAGAVGFEPTVHGTNDLRGAVGGLGQGLGPLSYLCYLV